MSLISPAETLYPTLPRGHQADIRPVKVWMFPTM